VHRPQLRNFIRHLKIEGEESEDLCQETFLRVWRAYDPDSCEQPKSVVFQTARNLIKDVARRQAVSNAALALIGPQLRDACDCLDPLRWVSGEWDLKRLILALGELSPTQQALVWYRPRREIA
jgi:RNA polymerase sigma factor (sigma-70 family)